MIDSQNVKAKAWKDHKEVVRVYCEERLTLREVGDKFDCSKETIRSILKALDVPRDPKKRPAKRRVFDTAEIHRLYTEENLTIQAISKKLRISPTDISKVLRSLGVQIKPGGFHLVAYPELRKLKIGDSIDLPRMTTVAKWTYTRYYMMAKNVGIRVSVKTVNEEKVRVTRKS